MDLADELPISKLKKLLDDDSQMSREDVLIWAKAIRGLCGRLAAERYLPFLKRDLSVLPNLELDEISVQVKKINHELKECGLAIADQQNRPCLLTYSGNRKHSNRGYIILETANGRRERSTFNQEMEIRLVEIPRRFEPLEASWAKKINSRRKENGPEAAS